MWTEVIFFAAGATVGWVGDGLRVALAPRRDRFFRPLSGPPVSLDIDDDPAVIWAGYPNWIGFDYYLPVDVNAVPDPPAHPHRWRQWALDLGGYDRVQSTVRLTLQGMADVTVAVETPQIEATRQALPNGGSISWPVGGASITPRQFAVDLGVHGPDFPIITAVEGVEEKLAMPWTMTLHRGEVEQILLIVRCDLPGLYLWRAKIPVLIDGKRHCLDVTDGGRDFRFVGGDPPPMGVWDGQKWIWRASETAG